MVQVSESSPVPNTAKAEKRQAGDAGEEKRAYPTSIAFQRASRLVTQDLMLYRVPTDLEVLMQILVGILMQTNK